MSSSVTKKLADVSATLVQQLAQNHALSAGDVNGDGFLDVLVNTLDLGNQLYLNDGKGQFDLRQDLIPRPMSGGYYLTNTSSGIVDVNGDGAPDLILGSWPAGHGNKVSQVLLNDGTGRFTKLAPIPLPASVVPFEIILDAKGIDLNGDGLTDLMLSITNDDEPGNSRTDAYYQVAYIQLLVSQGNGKFTDETATRLPASVQDAFAAGWFVALAAVDIDRDGHPDIVATGAGTPSVVLMNRGDGTFYQSWTSEVGGSTIAADVNGDGMLDLLTNVGSNTYVDINKLLNGHIYKAAIDGNNLIGSSGNDTMIGSSGNDVINGGAGTDVAAFSVVRANYVITRTDATITVQCHSGNDGTDTLTNVERLKFSDFSVALDVSGGHAGTTAKILGAVFGKAAVANKEYAGIGLNLLDGGMSYLDLMQLAINAKLGVGAGNAAVVDLLHTNVVGTPPPADELAFYQGLLDSGTHTQASLGVLAADTVLNTANINLVGLATTGLEYLPQG